MQVYIHTFIPTRDACNVSSLQPTEPIHVRLFFSEHHIAKEDYRQYMEWLNAVDQCTEFHSLGSAPASVSKASLLPPNAIATQVGQVTYDFMLESQDDYLAYLEFVRQTLKMESHRPVFRPQLKLATESKQDDSIWMHDYAIAQNSKVVKNREEIPKDSGVPTFILIHPPKPEKSNPIYDLWIDTNKQYADRAEFYRIEDVSATEPSMFYPCSNYCWVLCTSKKDVAESMNKRTLSLYQLSSGQLVQEKPYLRFWGDVLGTAVMPLIQVKTELALQGNFLIKKTGENVLETRLNQAQLDIVRSILTNPDIRPFSLTALYDLFATPITAKPIRQLIGLNTVGTRLRAINESLPHDSKDLQGTDAFACAWETVKATPHKTPDVEELKTQLRSLIEEFKNSADPQHRSDTSTSHTLFQHGFLLYLLHKQSSERITDYNSLIQCYKQSKMDLQNVEFNASHIPILNNLIADNVRFLDSVEPPEGITILEAQVLLSLYQYPSEYRNPQQEVLLFQLVTQQFAKTLKATEEGRVGAKALWEAYLAFLRKHRLDYVGFFGTQQEFNDILKDLGWEQKRMAQGKVWLKMELPS